MGGWACWLTGASVVPLGAAAAHHLPLGVTARVGGVIAVCLVAAGIDLATRRIPNWLTYPAAAWLAAATALGGPLAAEADPSPARAVAGFAVGFGFVLVVFLASGVGAGDVKLVGVVGLGLGFPAVLEMLLWSYAAACTAAFLQLLGGLGARRTLGVGAEILASPFRKGAASPDFERTRGRTLPMAPFYAFGTAVTAATGGVL